MSNETTEAFLARTRREADEAIREIDMNLAILRALLDRIARGGRQSNDRRDES